jgi:hypothetical protein
VVPSSEDKTGATRSSTRAPIDGIAAVDDTCCTDGGAETAGTVDTVDETEFDTARRAATAGVTETESALGAVAAGWPAELPPAPPVEAPALTADGVESTCGRFRDLCRFDTGAEESDPEASDPEASDVEVAADEPVLPVLDAATSPDAEPFA